MVCVRIGGEAFVILYILLLLQITYDRIYFYYYLS